MLVEVEFVIVPLVAEIFVGFRVAILKLVIVALVSVALDEVRYEVEAVRRFAESELVVDALVVDAFSVAKLPVVPNSVPMVAEVKLAIAA